MQVVYHFRHMTSSDALKSYTDKKLQAIFERFMAKPLHVEVSFDAEHDLRVACAVTVKGHGIDLHIEDRGRYMYDCVDQVAGKLEVRLQRRLDKRESVFTRAKRQSQQNQRYESHEELETELKAVSNFRK
jgi:ribosomal subunit interface protein